jgi:hypothetical protein
MAPYPIISEVYQVRQGWYYDRDLDPDNNTLVGFRYDGLAPEIRGDKHLCYTGAVIVMDIFRMQLLPSSEPFTAVDGYFLASPEVKFTMEIEHFHDIFRALDAPEFGANEVERV